MSVVLRNLILFCKKPKTVVRGPRWLINKAIAECCFELDKKTEMDFIISITGSLREELVQWWKQGEDLPWPLLYTIVRASKPSVVVETGVATGRSSFSILQALDDNNLGMLHSIELAGARQFDSYGYTYYAPRDEDVGSLVPAQLRHRWHLILGDAREELPPLSSSLGPIDIFLHDSLHTEEHMLFEFETAWPHLREGGYLLADDISFSFRRFASAVKKPYLCVGDIPRFGGIRK